MAFNPKDQRNQQAAVDQQTKENANIDQANRRDQNSNDEQEKALNKNQNPNPQNSKSNPKQGNQGQTSGRSTESKIGTPDDMDDADENQQKLPRDGADDNKTGGGGNWKSKNEKNSFRFFNLWRIFSM